MSILVTGGTGFIGGKLLERLVETPLHRLFLIGGAVGVYAWWRQRKLTLGLHFIVLPAVLLYLAFRNIFHHIPYDSAVDEASIEPLIIGQGLRLLYAPEAIIRNKGPETVRDFLKQHRRIFAGHLYVKDLVGYHQWHPLSSLRP